MAKVLLVDDDLTTLQVVSELLRQEGHEVFPFSNGNAAIAGLTYMSEKTGIDPPHMPRSVPHIPRFPH